MVKKKKAATKRHNPPMKKVSRGTGWMKAAAVKFVKKNGQLSVLIRKPAKKKRSKRTR